MVRLKDNYFEKFYEFPFDYSRMKYYFLPDSKLGKYVYDAKVDARLKNEKKNNLLLPKGAVEDEFNELLRRTMGVAYDLNFDDNEQVDEKDKPRETEEEAEEQ